MGVCVACPREGGLAQPLSLERSLQVIGQRRPKPEHVPSCVGYVIGRRCASCRAWRIYTLYASFGLTHLTAPHSIAPISTPRSPSTHIDTLTIQNFTFQTFSLFVSHCQDLSYLNHSIGSRHWLRCSPSLLVFRCTWPALDLILLHHLQHSSFIITPHSVRNHGTDCHCGD